MSIKSVIIVMLAMLVGIVLLCLGASWLEKNFPGEKFDERQKTVRGRAYRLSFFAGVLCMLVAMSIMIHQVDGEKMVEPFLLVFCCIVIQAMVFHMYCLIHHAALPFSKKPVFPMIGYAFTGVIYLFSFRNTVARWPLSLVGEGTTGWHSLVLMFFWFSLSFMYLIQLLRREKE